MPFVVGENIGPYRIMEQLGRGGMATVFKAYHAALDRYVALKALHPAFMEDPNFHARFQREARVVAKLEHPNIVPIYDFAEYEERPYLVMKYIEGETLKAYLSQGPIAQDEMIKIVKAIGAGLTYAHKKGILHRDVKPSNVLLGTDGGIYLADFGLARIAQAGESTLSSDMMLGTPQYISPEQAMGLGELDERTDIYSFGVMLYEMAVGKVPFSADTPFSIIHDHIYTALPMPRSINPDVSEAVERVLLKALAKERDDRYPDANALARAFELAFLAEPGGTPVEVIPTPEQTFVPEPEPEPDPVVAETIPPAVAAGTAVAASVAAEVATPPPAVIDVETPVPDMREVQGTGVSAPPKKKKRRFRWWFIPVGLAMVALTCYCSFVGLGALVDLTDNGRIDPPNRPPAEQLPEAGQPDPFGDAPAQPHFDAPPLAEAQGRVDEDPENPEAWLELATSQWQLDQLQDARDALNKALELAGDNADFYFDTAYDLAQAQAWVDSARVYLLGIQRFYPDEIPEDVMEDFSEAAFWAAEYPEAERDIPIAQIAEVDMPLERVVRARYLFYHGDGAEAQGIAEEVLTRIKPGMPEAMLLQAEMLSARGETEAAIDILFSLLERDDIADWMWEFISYVIETTSVVLEDAQAAVGANPDDPWAYLALFEAKLSLGWFDDAQETVEQALRLDGGDPEISRQAAEIAANYGAWSQAARLYAYHIQLTPNSNRQDLVEKLIQALYYSAAEEGAPDIFAELENAIPDDERGTLRSIYRDTLLARYKLYYEDISEAQEILDGVLERAPNFPLAQLVRAEIFLMVGDYEAAVRILEALEQNPELPPWLHEETKYKLDEVKP